MFVAAGLWLAPTEGLQAWLAAAFFVLGIPIAIITLLPGSTYLELEAALPDTYGLRADDLAGLMTSYPHQSRAAAAAR